MTASRWLRRNGAVCAIALAGVVLSGCNAGRAFIASPGDYAEYRRVRLADNYDDRMAAAWEYLQRRPDGRYAKRLKAYFARAEPIYYRARRRNVSGLQAYLRSLPNGPHAEEALALLGVRNYDKRRAARGTRQARITQLRLDARKISRKAAATSLSWWVVELSRPSIWHQSWTELPRAPLVRYRLGHPTPVCSADPEGQVCRKKMVRRFVVSGDEGPVKRQQNLDLEVVLDDSYQPLSVTLSGVDLLLRGREAADNRALAGDDEQRRKTAADYARELTKALFAAERVCNGDTDASGGSVLDCDGVRITLQPGSGETPDFVLLTPLDVAVAPETGGAADGDANGGAGAAPKTGAAPVDAKDTTDGSAADAAAADDGDGYEP